MDLAGSDLERDVVQGPQRIRAPAARLADTEVHSQAFDAQELRVARRRGGRTLVLGVAAMLALLTWFYGPSVLTQAWNPYLPMTWFIVFVLAAILVGVLAPVLPARRAANSQNSGVSSP